MKRQHLIQAYLPQHEGRTRDSYVIAEDPYDALRIFGAQHPDRVPRNLWVLHNEYIANTTTSAPSTQEAGQ